LSLGVGGRSPDRQGCPHIVALGPVPGVEESSDGLIPCVIITNLKERP
jgi:hypothetical protein